MLLDSCDALVADGFANALGQLNAENFQGGVPGLPGTPFPTPLHLWENLGTCHM